ncbi:MAG: alpha/beta fold hydrolase [Chloroflexota bacterium]
MSVGRWRYIGLLCGLLVMLTACTLIPYPPKPPVFQPAIEPSLPSPFPRPYRQLTIDRLARRQYGLGELRFTNVLDVTDTFTRMAMLYPSDDLLISGFINVPHSLNNATTVPAITVNQTMSITIIPPMTTSITAPVNTSTSLSLSLPVSPVLSMSINNPITTQITPTGSEETGSESTQTPKVPVIIVIHGTAPRDEYQELAYTTEYADALSDEGYIVLHPDMRGYPPAEDGPNPMRIGYALDVLNLVALVRQQAGQPGPLAHADPEAIGLWGHSMGGGVALRTIVVSPHIRATLLFASMSGDELTNHNKLLEFTLGRSGYWAETINETPNLGDLERLSPINHLARVQSAVSIHHGTADLVPVDWSVDLCVRLGALNKDVECFFYEDAVHDFYYEDYDLFQERTMAFFERTLKN